MTLTIAQVEHIARLARLDLSEEEKEKFRGQLSQILEYFEQLQELDTQDISPTFRVLDSQSPLRPDQAQPGLSTSQALHNAPESEKDQFRVPPVLE